MRVNYRRAGQRCLLPLPPASPVSILPLATLAMPVIGLRQYVILNYTKS